MKWPSTKDMVCAAEKYAAICDDFAVKSYVDEHYWFNKNTAELLRAMSSRLQELTNGKVEGSPAQ